MQLENGLLHLFVLSDLEWEHFLVWRYSKINKDPHLGKTRFKMALNNHRDANETCQHKTVPNDSP